MHRKKTDIHHNRRLALIVGSSLAVVIAICLTVIFTAGGSNGNSNASSASQNAKATNCSVKDMGPVPVQVANNSSSCFIHKVIHPGSAAQQVAENLGCTSFKDTGPATLFSNDSGSCYIGSSKYAINTFPSKEARNNWLQTATQLGVVPKWETDTSVTYPSVD